MTALRPLLLDMNVFIFMTPGASQQLQSGSIQITKYLKVLKIKIKKT